MRRRPRPRLAGGRRALALGRPRRERRDAAAAAGPVADHERLLEHHPQGDGAARHRPHRLATGWRPRSARATPDSTSSTSTAATPTCSGRCSRRSTTSAPTPTAARSRTGPGCGSRRCAAVRDAVGSDCAIACRMAVSAAGGPGVELDEGLEFVRMADHLVDLWDVHIGSILEWSKDSGASRFFTEGWQLEWTGHVREATQQADRRRRPADDARADGRDHRVGRLGSDRRRPPEHRRPVPAREDPHRPHRRHPRLHRLQHVHLEGRRPPPHRLHPERDRRRGAPPRLAPGAVRPGRKRRPRGAGGGRRAGRDGVRARARPAGDAARAPGRRGRRAGRRHPLDPAPARPGRVGPAAHVAAGPARQAPERRDRDGRAPGRGRRCARRAPTWS